MKTITITRYTCFLILSLLSFCKDSDAIKKEEQKKNLITIFAYQKNVNETSTLTCSDANVSNKILEIANKYNEGCVKDSDCWSVDNYNISKYMSWGKSCYICIGRRFSILESKLELFKNDLAVLNANSCQGSQDMSRCLNDGCAQMTCGGEGSVCSETKCKITCGY